MENDFINIGDLILDNKSIVIGVSTGVDSMVLLDLFIKIKDKKNINIIIAHVNHGKRAQSIEEEAFIREFAKKNNIYIEVLSLNPNEFKDENFQSEARKLRYNFFFNTMKKYNADYLGLAHHANDNMETIIMRILRGSSLRGYAGMSMKSTYQGYTILRPLINTLKEDIYKYAKENQITYYEDISNKSDIYTRNRIRNYIIPEIFKENNHANLKFNEFSNSIMEASEFINECRNDFINKNVSLKKECKIINLEELKKQNIYIQKEVLFEVLKDKNLSKNNILEILKIINSSKPNIITDIHKQFTIAKEYNNLTIYNNICLQKEVNLLINSPGKYKINDTLYLIVEKKNNNNITKEDVLWYNINMFPLFVRSRHDGDKIKLSNGYKKVKDLLIDLKVGSLKRKEVLVVVDKQDEILAVLGYAKSVYLKQSKDNNIILRLGEK